MTLAPSLDHHVVQDALSGIPSECGDAGLVIEEGEHLFLALVDALGHGVEAHAAAMLALDFLRRNHGLPLVELAKALHEHLKGSRGAVAALCRLSIPDGGLDYLGVGNISVKILGNQRRTLVPRDGILGYMMASPLEQKERLFPGDILLMASDGLREHISSRDEPLLLAGSARRIANNMLANFRKANDDASCVVLRYGA